MIPRLLITPGEPAGIGPDIIIKIAQESWEAECVVIGDAHLLNARAKQLGLPLKLEEVDFNHTPKKTQTGTLKILPVILSMHCDYGKLNAKNASYVLNTLKIAADLCLSKKAQAIVTGPVHKGIMNQSGIAFSGHTEFFAECSGIQQTVMLFVVDQLRVALATTHLPLSKVAQAITADKLYKTLKIIQQGLKDLFHITHPRITVCGLNPHAGEDGYLGREEIDVIQPVIQKCRKEEMNVIGPLPADTAFTQSSMHNADVILAMYHDQGLPVVKYAGFDRAVNVTLGLPFIRTSVDHGTALDIAGTGTANAGSLREAILLAIQLGTR